MAKKVTHLRDEFTRTFTAYALIPVFIVALISCALAYVYWNKNVLERNNESRVRVCEALTTIISTYQEKAVEIASACNVDTLKLDKARQMEMYQELYKHVNILNNRSRFYLLDKEMNILFANNRKRPAFLSFSKDISWGVIGEIERNPDTVVISFVGETGSGQEQDLAVGKAIVEKGRVTGYLLFVIPGKYLRQVIYNPYVQFVVSDEYDYTPVATNDLFSNAAMNKIARELREATGYFFYAKQQFYMTKDKILDGKITVYAITPIGNMVNQYVTAVCILLGVLVILTITIIIRVRKETAEKTKVIDQLVEAFAEVKNGRLDTQLAIKTNNEFEIIAEAYHTMQSSLKNLMALNNQKVRETVISEIKQLESQFNPHFLFNTLENIRFMIKLDPNAANKMIVALSALLRYSIDNKFGEVTIEEDLTYTQNYLDIQKLRFGERLACSFRIDASVNHCIVPKLIFQPIIENAIKYGANKCGQLHIETEIWRDGDHMEIVIFDDGAGMSETALAELRRILAMQVNSSQHTGLYNVNRRIKLIYGDAYGLEIQSGENVGTAVRIILPARCSAC